MPYENAVNAQILPPGETMLVIGTRHQWRQSSHLITVCGRVGQTPYYDPDEDSEEPDPHFVRSTHKKGDTSLSAPEMLNQIAKGNTIYRWRIDTEGPLLDLQLGWQIHQFNSTYPGKLNRPHPIFVLEGNGTDKPKVVSYYSANSEFVDFPQDLLA